MSTPEQQQMLATMRARLRRTYLVLLFALAVGLGAALGVFVTPHLPKVLAVLGCVLVLGLMGLVWVRFARAPWPEDEEQPQLELAAREDEIPDAGEGSGMPHAA